jgi:hypothetical protein
MLKRLLSPIVPALILIAAAATCEANLKGE